MRFSGIGNPGQVGDIGVEIETVDLQPRPESGTAPVHIGDTAGHAGGIDPQVQPGELDIVGPACHLSGQRELPQPVGRHPVHGVAQPLQQCPQVVGIGVHPTSSTGKPRSDATVPVSATSPPPGSSADNRRSDRTPLSKAASIRACRTMLPR